MMMIIPTITKYLYEIQHNRQYWLTRAERRRAIRLACLIAALIAFSVFLWIKK